MRDLSMHILDLTQNSIAAGATTITISVIEDLEKDLMDIAITDNGRGMNSDLVAKAANPFFTTRTTRKVGLGIPLFKAAAEQSEGSLEISSAVGKGTTVIARFRHSHIDRAPLGNIAETVGILIAGNPDVDLIYRHKLNTRTFCFSTSDVKKELDGVPINSPPVISWIQEFIESNLRQLVI